MTTPQPPAQPAQPAPGPAPLADWGTRAVGFIIDILPWIIFYAITFWIPFFDFIDWLVGIAYFIYLGYLEGTGQTPGKAIMGIKLVNAQGEVVGTGLGIGREFVHIIDNIVCFLGWLLPLVDAKRQTIADKLLDTYVVTGAEKKPFSVDLWTKGLETGSTAQS